MRFLLKMANMPTQFKFTLESAPWLISAFHNVHFQNADISAGAISSAHAWTTAMATSSSIHTRYCVMSTECTITYN